MQVLDLWQITRVSVLQTLLNNTNLPFSLLSNAVGSDQLHDARSYANLEPEL
jgi:hypothetical protein